MTTSGVGALLANKCLQNYGAVLFEGAVQLKLFPETRIKLFE